MEKTKLKDEIKEYKHSNEIKKERKGCRVHWECQGASVKNTRVRDKTKFPIRAPETMPWPGTEGTPNWALKQQYCNKFPDGAPAQFTYDLYVNCSLFFFSSEIPDAYSSQKVPK